uniref:Uncharacterized protein n=1 Tax=Anguilla anguilla TaxID=7936 RepID=A0A0E9WTN0_ANGAN
MFIFTQTTIFFKNLQQILIFNSLTICKKNLIQATMAT